ncbi:SpoIIE family protein phosphatase [Streptomyces sp. NBC_01763]|uniref:SpoIIE family protein phosphatase n=1 Tax=Streptomyces sp. NBC_01763 TaxID=2975934 RepID=UPI002DD925C6|nr:SpoIIE family protein phosphatase [Streptomyces sp. NBC_01763]WSC40488.1 SpoIIE family protein phosphatase [Streptomyces sp. NBC_01763]
MKNTSAVGEHRRRGGSTRIRGTDVAATLYRALREAVHRLDAVAAVVYLLDEDHTRLRAAMIGGSPPSSFTLPGRMELDAPYASARALASGRLTVLADPDPAAADHQHVSPYPYIAISAPVITANHRFGAITVLRLETQGGCEAADCTGLTEIGDELAVALAELAESGAAITPGHMPVLVPAFGADPALRTPGWGVPGVPGSAGTSLLYPQKRLADMLNQATTMDHIVGAARYCVMSTFRAQGLVLASADEGRLWVLGHSGDSSGMVRNLHGARLDARTPAAEAVRGRPLFFSGGRLPATDSDCSEDESEAEAYLPLVGSRHVIDLPLIESKNVVGVCCLSFDAPRGFPPEERAILSMMAGALGAAVERVQLGMEQRAVAECLQRRLLPSTLSEVPRLTTTARYRPATVTSQVGGDWYDVIKLPGDRVVLVVGDVEGHAMESAAVMGQARSAVVAYATEGHRPAAVIDRTGRLLAELGTELLVTCCVVALDTADGMAEVALAGHPEPLVQRPDGSIGPLEAPANLPLGVATVDDYRGREHVLDPGSVLMLYSNGLVGCAATGPGAAVETLLGSGSSAAGADLEQLADRLIAEEAGPHQRRDDAVLLLARYEGAGVEGVTRTGSLHIQSRDLHGVKAARSFVEQRLRSWGLAEMSDDLELMVSEIVTNAIIHAGSDVDVRLRAYTDRVRLEVRDSDSNPPVPSPLSLSEEGNAEAEHGRGLLIVEALAGLWNSSPNGRGKTVSLDVPVPDA